MGQSREAKKTNRMLDTEYNDSRNMYNQYLASREANANQARGRSDEAYNTAFSGYRNFLDRYSGNPPGGGGGEGRAGYRRYSRGGGVTDENKQRIRGAGVFDEFARTGGYNEADKTNIRSRLTRSVPSFFENLKNEMSRQQVMSGGINPTFDASLAALARQSSQATGDAVLDAETDIQDRVNQGRMWGSNSLSDAESRLVDAIQRGEMFGIEGLARKDSEDSQYDIANRGLELEALGGIRGLRTDAPGEVGMYEGLLQNAMQGRSGNAQNLLQQRMQYNPNRSWIERMAPLINAGVGIGSMFLPGGQFRGGGAPRNTGITGGRSPYGGNFGFTPGTGSAGPGYYGVF